VWKDGLPKIQRKAHWNCIQCTIKDVNGKSFWKVEKQIQNFTKESGHFILLHAKLGHGLHMFTQHVPLPTWMTLTWTRFWRFKEMHKLK